MPPIGIRIHTSVIHLTTSHCTDPVTYSESPGFSPLFPAYSLVVWYFSLFLFLALSSSSTPTKRARKMHHCLDTARKQRKVYLGTDYYY